VCVWAARATKARTALAVSAIAAHPARGAAQQAFCLSGTRLAPLSVDRVGNNAEEVERMTRHRIASIRSIGPRFAAVAVCGLTLGAASAASAQTAETPQPTKGSCGEGNTKVTCPEMPQSPQQMTQAPSTESPTAQAPILPPTTPYNPATGTTQTTAAEYTENVAAEQRRTTYKPNPWLMGSGAILFGGSYGASVIVAAADHNTASNEWTKNLYIPVAGPWITLGKDPCTFATRCTTADNWNGALMIGSGIAQGAGLVLMATSFFVPAHKTTTVVAAQNQKPQKPRVSFAPVSYKGGAGVGASGTF
jgi:hypothetical protein